MRPVLTANEAREVDRIAIEDFGFDSTLLMENAGRSIATFLDTLQAESKTVTIICGKGNNGGDGFVAARHLRDMNWRVTVVFVDETDEFTEETFYAFELLTAVVRDISIFKYKDVEQLKELLAPSFVILDALLGTGSKGEPRFPYDEIIVTLNEEAGIKVSIDIPSGLDPDTGNGGIVFRADYTVALCTLKRGYFYGKGMESRGMIDAGYIGFHADSLELDENWKLYELSDVRSVIPSKSRTINKYSCGGPVVIAGSNRYPGSATLAYMASFNSGSGSPVIFTSEKAAAVLLGKLPEAVVTEFPVNFNSEYVKSVFDALIKKDVLLVGPGIGISPETTIALEKILKIENRLVILDADALVPLHDGNYTNYNLRGKILLPHTGEFARILGKPLSIVEQDIFQAAENFAKETGCILVLKHSTVFISTSVDVNFILDSGTIELAKFGTGDGIAGVIASTFAQLLALPAIEVEEVMNLLMEQHPETLEFFASRIADAIHTFNLSALLLGKDSPGEVISASTIIKNLPVAIKKIEELT